MDKGSIDSRLRELKVLYVEDDDETRDGVKVFLKRRVGKILAVRDGQEALKAFSAFEPDVVIADLIIPKISGVDMLKNIRQQDSECRIVITSSVKEPSTVVETVDLGIVKYIIKPIILKNLEDCLEKIALDLLPAERTVGINFEQKKEYEVLLKRKMTTVLKTLTGKGPRDVMVTLQDEKIEIVAYDTLTVMETNLVKKGRSNIVYHFRKEFYETYLQQISQEMRSVIECDFTLKEIEVDTDRGFDRLVLYYSHYNTKELT